MNIKNFAVMTFFAASLFIAPAYGNGNTTADAPEPLTIKKSVRKATIKRPVKKSAPKAKKAAPKKTVVKAPVQTSLDRGIEFMNQNQYALARPWLQKAVQENRNSAAAWYWYGMYHEKTGKFYEAQYFYTKAVQADPTFDPLSRVVNYPNDANKIPVWDPKRPARIYEIPTATRAGTIIPPNSPTSNRLPSRPNAQNNPEIPRVPVYTPPEPGAMPSDGDKWRPSVYVPPSGASAQATQNVVVEGGAVYVPPSGYINATNNLENNNLNNNSGLIFDTAYSQSDVPQAQQAIYNPPLPVMPELNREQAAYQPPAPDNKSAANSNAKTTVSSANKNTPKAPAKTSQAKTAASKTKKTASTKSTAKRTTRSSASKTNSARNTTNNNSRPQTQSAQSQPQNTPRQQQTQNQPRQQTQSQPRQQQQSQTQRPQINELPPVGQTTNNGAFEVPLPPVGHN